MGKKNGNGASTAGPKVRYADAQGVSRGLAKFADLLPLPMNVALRGGRIQRETAEAAEVHQNEARKRGLATAKRLKGIKENSPEASEIQYDADLNFAAEAGKTFQVRAGWIAWSEVETAVASWRKMQEGKEAKEREPEPPGLGNILALIMPVLDGAPE